MSDPATPTPASREDAPRANVCGDILDFRGEILRCVREPHDGWPHRTRNGTQWQPAGWTRPDVEPLLKWEGRAQ